MRKGGRFLASATQQGTARAPGHIEGEVCGPAVEACVASRVVGREQAYSGLSAV